MPMQPIERQNVSDMVFNQLSALISNGEWKPGDKIPSETELAKTLNVSRISIRAALQKLESLGIITRVQGRGTVINDYASGQVMNTLLPMLIFEVPDIIHVNDFRSILETGSARLASTRCTDEDLKSLMDNLTAMREAAAMKADTALLDVQFHYLIACASRNPLIVKTFDVLKSTLIDNMYKVKQITGDADSLFYHAKLFNALSEHDPLLAEKAMNDHLSLNRDVIEATLKQERTK